MKSGEIMKWKEKWYGMGEEERRSVYEEVVTEMDIEVSKEVSGFGVGIAKPDKGNAEFGDMVRNDEEFGEEWKESNKGVEEEVDEWKKRKDGLEFLESLNKGLDCLSAIVKCMSYYGEGLTLEESSRLVGLSRGLFISLVKDCPVLGMAYEQRMKMNGLSMFDNSVNVLNTKMQPAKHMAWLKYLEKVASSHMSDVYGAKSVVRNEHVKLQGKEVIDRIKRVKSEEVKRIDG